jgi:hypothetical protein
MVIEIMTNGFAANFQNREIPSVPRESSAREALLADAFLRPLRELRRQNKDSRHIQEDLREKAGLTPEGYFKDFYGHPKEKSKHRQEKDQDSSKKNDKATFKSEVIEELYKGINRIKKQHGEKTLDRNEKLASDALANSKIGFGHHGIHKGRENAAWAPRQKDETAKHYANRILNMWMKSPGHRANLLYAGADKMGIGISGSNITLAIG